MRRGFALCIVAGCAAALACQLLVGIDDRTVWDPGTDSGIDTGPDPCTAPDVPPAPPLSTSSSSDNVTVTAALSRVMLGATDGGPYYGFNLDHTCTCTGSSGDSCQRAAKQGPACDNPNGVDNYALHAFEEINLLAGDAGLITEARLNSALAKGLSGALIQISSYNGQKDDGEVTVTVYASQGYANYPTPPAFDGGDHWTLDPSSANGQFSTSNAYVVNYTLVASLTFPIIVGSAYTEPVTIQLESGLIRADLQMNGTTLVKMTGMLGGRWDPAKFLPSLQSVPDPASAGKYLCGTDTTYTFLKSVICANLDINASPLNDGTGVCNALSMGLGFEALPAQLGDAGAVIDSGAPCGPTWTDKCQ